MRRSGEGEQCHVPAVPAVRQPDCSPRFANSAVPVGHQQVFQSITRELGSARAMSSAERLGSGGSRFENQVAWARWYLVNAGFIDGSRRGICEAHRPGWATEFLKDDALRNVFEQTQAKYRGADIESGSGSTAGTFADATGHREAETSCITRTRSLSVSLTTQRVGSGAKAETQSLTERCRFCETTAKTSRANRSSLYSGVWKICGCGQFIPSTRLACRVLSGPPR